MLHAKPIWTMDGTGAVHYMTLLGRSIPDPGVVGGRPPCRPTWRSERLAGRSPTYPADQIFRLFRIARETQSRPAVRSGFTMAFGIDLGAAVRETLDPHAGFL